MAGTSPAMTEMAENEWSLATAILPMSPRNVTELTLRPPGLTFWRGDGLLRSGHQPATQPKRSGTDGKLLRNLRAPLCDDVAAHAPLELPGAGSARDHCAGPRLFRLADQGRRPRHSGRY